MKKLISILLSLILLTSNMGFAITTHYCGGFAVESKLIIGYEKLDCGMPGMDVELQNTPDSHIHFSKGICCENDYKYLDTEDNLNSSTSHHFINFQLLKITSYTPTFASNKLKTTGSSFKYSSPPLVGRYILTLHQVFRL